MLKNTRSYLTPSYSLRRITIRNPYSLHIKNPHTLHINKHFICTLHTNSVRTKPYSIQARFNHSVKKSLKQQLLPFIKFAKPEYKIVGLSIVLLFISSSVTMSVPMSMGVIIDIVMQNMDQVAASNKGSGFVYKLLEKTGSLTGLFAFLGGIFAVGAFSNAGKIY